MFTECMAVRMLVGLLCSLSVAVAAATGPAPFTIHVGPNGSDSADGASEARAVASLQLAVDRAISALAAGSRSAEIVVGPGLYEAQRVTTSGAANGAPIRITARDATRRPLFDGGGGGGTWFTLRADQGRASNIEISGLEVARYSTAISFNGKRASQAAFNGGNRVLDMVFREIGQIADPSGAPSTAVIRLVNSRDNEIAGNRFVNVRNVKQCSLLHAVYIANHSSGNVVSGNEFDGGCGAPVKVRDGSNDNIVRGNVFRRQEARWILLDDFCDRNIRLDCTKQEHECPSWNNRFIENKVYRAAAHPRWKLQEALGSDAPNGCAAPPAGAKRISEQTNVVQ